jgi:hypothetical protein
LFVRHRFWGDGDIDGLIHLEHELALLFRGKSAALDEISGTPRFEYDGRFRNRN